MVSGLAHVVTPGFLKFYFEHFRLAYVQEQYCHVEDAPYV